MNFSLLRKLSFILNLAFLTAMLMRFYPIGRGTAAASAVIVSGLLLSPLMNGLTTLQVCLRSRREGWPKDRFIVVFNAILLLLQMLLFFFTGWLSLGNSQL